MGAQRLLAVILLLVTAMRSLAADGPSASVVPEWRRAEKVVVITIRGAIDQDIHGNSVMARSVTRRIELAERAGADAIVFEIDTPGGSVPAVLEICNRIKSSTVTNTVAWVNPSAYSGGAVIALACREIVVTSPATLGDAQPISVMPLMGAQSVSDPQLLKKILPPLISEVLDSTRRHNEFFADSHPYRRDEYLAQAIVANDVELWRVRDTTTGVEMCIDRREFEMLFPGQSADGPTRLATAPGTGSGGPLAGSSTPGVPSGSRKLAGVVQEVNARLSIATSRRPTISPSDAGRWALVDKVLDGSSTAVLKSEDLVHYNFASNPTKVENGQKTIVPIRSDEDLRNFFGATQLRRLDRSWSERFVLILTNLVVRGVLLVIFLVALFIEITHPGTIVPGTVAAGAFLLLVAPPLLIGMANWWEIAAILLGIVLIALEVFFIPGFGVAGILGVILLFAGLVGTFTSSSGLFPSSGREQTQLLTGMTTVLLSLTTAGVAMYFIAKHFGSIPVLGKLVLKNTSGDDEDTMLTAIEDDTVATVKPGQIGQALTPMRPSGRVQVGEQIVDAVASVGFIDPGTPVRVTSVTTFRIAVEAVHPPGGSREEKNDTGRNG